VVVADMVRFLKACRETNLLTHLSGQAVTDCQGKEWGASYDLSTGTATPRRTVL